MALKAITDAINLNSKDQHFPNAPQSLWKDREYHSTGKYYVNGSRMHEYLREIEREPYLRYNLY